MNFTVRLVIGTVVLIGFSACGGPQAPPPPPPVPIHTAQAGFARVAAEVLDWRFARHPALATRLGEHAHDEELPAVFPGDLARAQRDARALLTRLEQVNRVTLEPGDHVDYRLLDYGLRAALLDLEDVAGWQRDPVRYLNAVSAGMFSLYADSALPPDARIAALAARLRAVPMLFRAARQNLDAARVPPLFARMAVDDARVLSRRIMSGDSPPGAARMSDRMRAEWEAARRVAVASTDSFATWIEQTLLPAARGDFRLGSSALGDYLLYAQHVALPLEDVQAINRRAIADYREWLDRVALQADPMRHADEIVDSLARSVPGASEMVERPLASISSAREIPVVRRAFATSAVDFALAHYNDLAEIESEATSAMDRLSAIRRALHAHALLGAMLALHATNATVDQVAADVANMAFIDREQARREVELVAYDPAYGLAALGRMQIFALRERVRAQRGVDFSDAAFIEELAALGLPIPLAAVAMFGRDPEPLLAVGQPTPGVPGAPSVLD